jgi:hypothetical protein
VWIAPEQWSALSAATSAPALPPSDELLLDAMHAMPHIGAAVVLAHTAIEVRIFSALNSLASTGRTTVGSEMWTWINDRGSKDPSVEEQLTDLLRILTGKSLKTEVTLWAAYTNLRKARNSFVHEGKAMLLDRSPVTKEKAHELLGGALAIVEWIETSLPELERAPRVATPERTIQRMFPIGRAQ